MKSHWPVVEIGEITLPVEKVDPVKLFPKGEFKYVDISSIDSKSYKVAEAKTFLAKNAPSRARQVVKENDIAFSTVRTNLKRIAKIGKELDKQIASTGFAIIRSAPQVVPSYLFYYLITDEFTEEVSSLQRGASYPAVRPSDVFSRRIPLPPLPEQKRIIAKLDILFAHLDQLRARLDKIPVLLKQFRQAVLTQGVTGKLTEEWRKNVRSINGDSEQLLLNIQQDRIRAYQRQLELSKKGKGKKPKAVDDNSFMPVVIRNRDLPDSWKNTRIRDLADCLDYIRKPINKDERATRQGSVPYYGANGQVGLIDDYLFDEDLVVVVEDETFIGREIPFSYIIRGKSWVNNHAHVLRPLGGITVEYLNISLAYYNFIPLTAGTTGRRKLTQKSLLEAILPVAPLEEQGEIIRRVESLFTLSNRVETSYQILKEKLDHLPQGILSKAFGGELIGNELEAYSTPIDSLFIAAEPS